MRKINLFIVFLCLPFFLQCLDSYNYVKAVQNFSDATGNGIKSISTLGNSVIDSCHDRARFGYLIQRIYKSTELSYDNWYHNYTFDVKTQKTNWNIYCDAQIKQTSDLYNTSIGAITTYFAQLSTVSHNNSYDKTKINATLTNIAARAVQFDASLTFLQPISSVANPMTNLFNLFIDSKMSGGLKDSITKMAPLFHQVTAILSAYLTSSKLLLLDTRSTFQDLMNSNIKNNDKTIRTILDIEAFENTIKVQLDTRENVIQNGINVLAQLDKTYDAFLDTKQTDQTLLEKVQSFITYVMS